MDIRTAARALLFTLLLVSANAGAAILQQTFMNDFQANALYLWSVDASNMTLDGISFGSGMGDWKALLHTTDQLVISGSSVAASAGRFNLIMGYKHAPFQLEWAEVFFDNVTNVVRGFGTLTFNGSGWSNADVATHLIDIPLHPAVAATPLPSSALLLASALVLGTLGGMRKRALI